MDKIKEEKVKSLLCAINHKIILLHQLLKMEYNIFYKKVESPLCFQNMLIPALERLVDNEKDYLLTDYFLLYMICDICLDTLNNTNDERQYYLTDKIYFLADADTSDIMELYSDYFVFLESGIGVIGVININPVKKRCALSMNIEDRIIIRLFSESYKHILMSDTINKIQLQKKHNIILHILGYLYAYCRIHQINSFEKIKSIINGLVGDFEKVEHFMEHLEINGILTNQLKIDMETCPFIDEMIEEVSSSTK